MIQWSVYLCFRPSRTRWGRQRRLPRRTVKILEDIHPACDQKTPVCIHLDIENSIYIIFFAYDQKMHLFKNISYNQVLHNNHCLDMMTLLSFILCFVCEIRDKPKYFRLLITNPVSYHSWYWWNNPLHFKTDKEYTEYARHELKGNSLKAV